MPAPSQLSIATSAVGRLVKEEASYHKEIIQQEGRIAKLEQNNGDEYELRQEVCSSKASSVEALTHCETETSSGRNTQGLSISASADQRCYSKA